MYYIDCNAKIESINYMHKLLLRLSICLLINCKDVLASLRVIGNDKYGGGTVNYANNPEEISGYAKNTKEKLVPKPHEIYRQKEGSAVYFSLVC